MGNDMTAGCRRFVRRNMKCQQPLDWSLAIFKKRTKHVVIASEVKQPSTEF
jgi:hypothetical protein